MTMTPTERSILAAIAGGQLQQTHVEMTQVEIAVRSNCDERTVRRITGKLHSQGIVERNGKGGHRPYSYKIAEAWKPLINSQLFALN